MTDQIGMRHYCEFVRTAGEFLAVLSYANACDNGELPGAPVAGPGQDWCNILPRWVPSVRFHYPVVEWVAELLQPWGHTYVTSLVEETLSANLDIEIGALSKVSQQGCYVHHVHQLARTFVHEMTCTGIMLSDSDWTWYPEGVSEWLLEQYAEIPDFLSVVPEWKELMKEQNEKENL